MTSRKKENVLLDLLTSGESDSSPELEELSSFITRGPGQDQKQREKRRSKKEIAGNRIGRKRRVTHYLSPATFDHLDLILPKIREILPKDFTGRLSRSSLVDSSLRILIRDFEKQGERSLLAQWFLEDHAHD